MQTEINEIEVNGVKYIRKDQNNVQAEKVDGMEYCVIRSYGAGVFCGYVKEKESELNGVNVELINSRRIWYWAGAYSLSQLAVEGLKKLDESKIAMVVPRETIMNVVEIIPMSEFSANQIQKANIWKQS